MGFNTPVGSHGQAGGPAGQADGGITAGATVLSISHNEPLHTTAESASKWLVVA
ncbi:unannotated protein [freshwater metagenome]|uniref:Unannotated protein n=1 Tax=freshwater metagenome TaxID=449393 RepID=A0A6J6ZJK2_9ZZZZ